MTASGSELPSDLSGCHTLIEDLQQRVEELQQQRQQDAERLAQLQAINDEQRATIGRQQETIDELTQAIENLQGDIKLLRRALYGSRRERYTDDPNQTFLFRTSADDETGKASKGKKDSPPKRPKRTSKGRRRRVFPEFLPREEERHPLDEEEIPPELKDNPAARRFFKKTGEQVEYIPPQLKVVEVFQEVVVLEQDDGETTIRTASKPPQLINSFAGPSLLAYLTVSRFGDHLPYYRQEDILGRIGFRIHRSTQWRWMRGLAAGVTPLVELMQQEALLSSVLQVDETPVKVLEGGVGKALTGYLWTTVGDRGHPYSCFFYTPDRSRAGPNDFLSGFAGYLMADAYVGYDLLPDVYENIVKVTCWAHARRKFEEVHHLGATDRTHAAMAYMKRLFDIEDRYRESSDEERHAARQREAKPIVESFHEWMLRESPRLLPKSRLLGAMNYMLTRWESFERYLESGEIPFDNNFAERTLKFPILGRKAWLFIGNNAAGEAAAKLFTLTTTCNRLRIDPYAYLADVYRRLPTLSGDELSTLLPDRWLQEHPEHLVPERVHEAMERARRKREERAARRRPAA